MIKNCHEEDLRLVAQDNGPRDTEERLFMKISGLLAIGLVMLVSTRTASANLHSGTLCTAPGGADAAANTSYIAGGVFNSCCVPRPVICGGVTDGTVTSVSITVFDVDPANNIDCTIFLFRPDGSTVFSTTVSSSGFGSASQTLTAATPAFAGVVALQCSIPPCLAATGCSRLASYAIGDSL